MRPSPRRRPLLAALLGAALVLAWVPAGTSALAASFVPDGRTPATAAASCWEVKQVAPDSPSAPYWLLTPALRTPTQFFCDMTTDGGGWVLVGRGRDGWIWDGDAQGTPAQVAANTDTPAGFAPRKLSSATIDALLGRRRVDALTEGVRLRRATSTDGSSWQEVRFRAKAQAGWTWALGAGVPLAASSVDGSALAPRTTRDFGITSTAAGDELKRVWTFESPENGYVRGFNHGASVRGTTASDSYLYATAGGYATPFTQVWVRPRLRQADLAFTAVPDAGTAPVTALPVAESGSLPQPWGVTGTGSGGTGELGTEVQAFAQVGDVMYVGGNFTTVRNQDGTSSVAQPYLAAFDATTGEWIPSFRPKINRQVRALVRLPGDRLAVGGDFTTVNGSTRRGLAVFTATGALDTTWTTGVVQTTGDKKPTVRALDVVGGRLYVGGRFTHVRKGSTSAALPFVARVSSSSGSLDTRWAPRINGTVADLDTSTDGTRVYLAGYMTKSRSTTVRKGVALSTAATAPLASSVWTPTYSTSGSTYQQAVRQVGSLVWLGGSQHSMFGYAASTLKLEVAHLTKAGGDLQAIGDNGKVVYGGCHCGDWAYTGTTAYDRLKVGSTTVEWKQAGKISLLGAWDAASGAFVTTFAPRWKSRGGFGVWAVAVGRDGTLWAGGSIETSVKDGGGTQFSGGFARFAPRPSTTPAAPTEPTATLAGGTATVGWKASGTSGVTYEVLRDDRVVALTGSTSVSVPGATAGDRYAVRAADGRGNWSASTRVVGPSTP